MKIEVPYDTFRKVSEGDKVLYKDREYVVQSATKIVDISTGKDACFLTIATPSK